MKKTLLSFLCLLGAASMAVAANVTEDFTNWEKTQSANNPQSVTSKNTGLTWTFTGDSYVTQTSGVSYVMLKCTSNNQGAIAVPIGFEVAEIQIETPSSPSTNQGNTISILVGDTELAAKFKVNAAKTTFKFPIEAAKRVASGTYTFKSDGSKNSQIAKITFVEATTAPTLSATVKSVAFAVPLNGKQEVTVKATAENITENIAVSVDNDAFTLSSASLTAAEAAEGVVVTYNGKAAGNTSATLTFSVGDLKAEVALSGITVANEGTEANPLTVADVIALANANKGPFYVEGIINEKTAANAVDGKIQEADTPAATNIILKDAEGNMIPVALPAGDNRAKLNIVDNPSNVGKTVIVKGTLEAYYGATGVKNAEYVSGLDSTTGIEDIDIDSVNAPVEYFNLQGVRVANPENGLFIRRQGNKVTKVIIK